MLTMKPGATAIATAFTLIAARPLLAAESPSKPIPPAVKSVEFMGMEAPDTAEKRARTYTEAKIRIIYANDDRLGHQT